MADFSIDQNNLPGVKEVCRDFAVLEDHCLAYTLQEQEIESHLASNIHKSRLIQTDLRVAKRIQEEEDVQAKALTDRHQRVIEQSDTEIAQVFQDHLVRQAALQRQQEKKDEAMARKLHKQMIKEDRKLSKKNKKQQGPSMVEPYGKAIGAFPPASGSPRGSPHASPEPSRGGFPQRTGRGGQGRDGSLSQSAFYTDDERPRGAAPKKEKPARPPPPQSQGRGEGREGEGEGGRRVGTAQLDAAHGSSGAWPEEEMAELEALWGSEGLTSGFEESSHGGRGTIGPQEGGFETCSLPSPGEPDRLAGCDYGMREVTQGVNQMELQGQELSDMEIARRLQEEELKASQADTRAAQVAQDEEIARLLIEEERKACKSSKKWGKKKLDGQWSVGAAEVVIPRSGEDCEQQRSQSQRPARPPPPMHSYENVESRSLRAPARPEPTYRGSHDKQ